MLGVGVGVTDIAILHRGGSSPPAGGSPDALLLEDGSYLLLEDGSKLLLG